MGKNLKGKELGKGLGQRKDGLYYARCMSRSGQRLEKCFSLLSDAKNWRKEQEYLRLNSELAPALSAPAAEQAKLYMRDLVFINFRTGLPAKNSSYDTHLYKLCENAGIEHFCMHALRHTYATRAIEHGVPPKVLQKLLGHSSIKTTMDRYVHVTDDTLFAAVTLFQAPLPA